MVEMANQDNRPMPCCRRPELYVQLEATAADLQVSTQKSNEPPRTACKFEAQERAMSMIAE